MQNKILPFFVKQSKTKLTDRGSIAIVDEFMTGLKFTQKLDKVFPLPGSGRGINYTDYVLTLIYHFSDGGRFLEEIQSLKADGGFRSLIQMKHMPGSDAVGNWLRRFGKRGGTNDIEKINDFLVERYIHESNQQGFVLDIDSTFIVSNKGDAAYSYKNEPSYHPMLGFLSDGRSEPICSYEKFRQGNVSAQTDILETIQHNEILLSGDKHIREVRIDSAGYQCKVIDYCNDNGLHYTITADQDSSVKGAIERIKEDAFNPLYDRLDGFKTHREVAEITHTMNNANHCFRLIVQRELKGAPDIFGSYHYYCIITNIPKDKKTAEEVVWHHQGRGNCERYIEDTKYGVNLRFVPCGQFEANALYYSIGILTFNLLKLMQMMVLPESHLKRTVLSLRRGFFRMVAKVTSSKRRWELQVDKHIEHIRQIIRVREKIWLLTQKV
ncbi:MAG: IS1380 family transposase [Candidatus Marinimicrobia bacterium]|nr:IS1380 family transposase [Candidatus Neomarinimicrobiota bacterium]